MRIRVTPDLLRGTAAFFRRSRDRMDEVYLTIRRAWDALDWEIRREAALEARVVQAKRQALTLRDEAERLRRFLEERATAFDQADQEGTIALGQAFLRWTAKAYPLLPTSLSAYLTFPERRVQVWERLRDSLGRGDSLSLRPSRIAPEPDEKRALLHLGLEMLISKIEPLGLLKDLLDTVRLPAWQAKVERTLRLYREAAARYGVNSPQARSAYGNYVETLIFRMPLLETEAQALLAALKILGRANPVE